MSESDDEHYRIPNHPPPLFKPKILSQVGALTNKTLGRVGNRLGSMAYEATPSWPWYVIPLLSILAFLLSAFVVWWLAFGLKGLLGQLATSMASFAGLTPPREVPKVTDLVPEGKVLVDR